MRSIADDLRDDSFRRIASMSVADRIKAALALGEEDVRVLMAASGLERRDAEREISLQRQVGRRRSRCHESLFFE